MRRISLIAFAAAFTPVTLRAQDGVIVYQLGRDTVAIEQFSRTAARMQGEMVTRSGAAVTRTQYDLTLAGGRVTAATVKRLQPDGTPIPNTPIEYRFTFRADSVTRQAVWRDSTQSRTFAAPHAFPNLPVFVYAPFELLRADSRRDSVPAIGLAGNAVGYLGMEAADGAMRLRGAPYAMLLSFDRDGRLQRTDGSFTTNKAIGTRGSGRLDLATIAQAMKPTGVLSPRMTAYASFFQGPITINYGSPAVRGRTVWGGTLVPYDSVSVWRTGANEATHLATSKTMQLGDMTLAPGLYTLWVHHTRAGTWLIVNRQVGQWGTAYNPANDVGRVAMELAPARDHAEDFTITIRPLPQARGTIEMAWGDRVATVGFAVRP